LEAFAKIQTQYIWEMIVVDNHSSDDTLALLNNFSKQASYSIKSVCEKKQGLGNARNRGVMSAKYDVIAMTDDDCYPAIDYIDSIAASLEKHDKKDTNLGFIGGRVELYDKRDLPVTIQTHPHHQYFNKRRVVVPGHIHGANLIFKKQAIVDNGFFDPLFGSGAMFPCEDIDLMASCLESGLSGVYDPTIVVFHDHGRRTKEELIKLETSYDLGRGAFLYKHIICKRELRKQYFLYWCKESLKMKFKGLKNEIAAAVKYARQIK